MKNTINKNNRKIIICVVIALLVNSLFFWNNTYPDRYAIKNERNGIFFSQLSLRSPNNKDISFFTNQIETNTKLLAEDNAKVLKKLLIMGAIDLLIISIGLYMFKKRKH